MEAESIRRLVGGGGMAALREAVMETEGAGGIGGLFLRFVIWRQDQMRMDQMEASAESPGCVPHGYELGKHFLVEGTASLETESGELLKCMSWEAEASKKWGTTQGDQETRAGEGCPGLVGGARIAGPCRWPETAGRL